RQRDAAVAAHRDRDRAGIVNSLRCRLDALERIGYPTWRHPNIAAIDETEARHRVEVSELRAESSHQHRLRADCSRTLSRSDPERMNPAVERRTQHRRLRTLEIMRMRSAHKCERLGVQLIVREIDHLCGALESATSIGTASFRHTIPLAAELIRKF